MKTRVNVLRTATRGWSLIELLVYMGVVFTILGVGYTALDRCQARSKALRRGADELVQTLKAGELWRRDVRGAVTEPRVETAADGLWLRLPQTGREVAYRFQEGVLWRRTAETAPWHPVGARLKSSRMESEARQHVRVWRWEVELIPTSQSQRIRPLLTFEAVPVAAVKP